MAAGVHMERHDGVYLRRIAYEAVIDIDLSAEGEFAVRRAVTGINRTVRLDLRKVFLIDGVGDVGGGKERQIDVGDDAVERTGDASTDVGGQVSIDRQRTVLRQFDRSKTIGSKGDIHPHSVEVQTAVEGNERAVHAVDGKTVEVHFVVNHNDRRLA